MLPLNETFRFRGHDIAWDRIGNGPPLVLVHGFPWSSQAWRRIAPSLAARRTVYYFDLLGSGRSAKTGEVPSQIQGTLLAELIGHWGLQRPEIVAHDFGGLAALRALFVEGASYGRLTLIDAVAVLPSGSPLFSHIREHEAAFAALPSYAHEALFRAYAQNAASRPMPGAAMDLYLEPWRGDEGQAAFYRWIAQSNLRAIEELQPHFARPDCPVHLLWGGEDGFIPPAQGRALAERLGVPGPDIVEGAGHLIQEDAPEEVVGRLLNAMRA